MAQAVEYMNRMVLRGFVMHTSNHAADTRDATRWVGVILGPYLVIAALVEFWAYYSHRFSLFLLPRAGWAACLAFVAPDGDFAVEFPEIFSAGLLLTLGILFILGKSPLKAYIALEAVLGLPTLLLLGLLLVSGGGHVVGGNDAPKLLLVVTGFTLLPLLLAILALRGRARGTPRMAKG